LGRRPARHRVERVEAREWARGPQALALGAGLIHGLEKLARVAAASAAVEPDARRALADERHVHVLVPLPDVGELAAVLVDLVEAGVLLDAHPSSGRNQPARDRGGRVPVALVVLLRRV